MDNSNYTKNDYEFVKNNDIVFDFLKDIIDYSKSINENKEADKDIDKERVYTINDKRDKYRMYCFVLRQLSPIQKGIQSAHAIVEYSNKYGDIMPYNDWSTMDKTIIMLDVDDCNEMADIIARFDKEIDLAYFKEESLDDLTTCTCFLVPEYIYNARRDIFRNRVEECMSKLINSKHLSR